MTAVLKNAARERLAAGELALGVILRQARTVDIAAIMQSCGYDFLFLDLEHNSMDLDTAVQIAIAALGAGIAAVARVPAGQLWLATRFLDGGGLGIVFPHVDTPEEATRIAQALRYPPRGHRSVAGGLPHFGYAKLGLAETCEVIDAATLVTVMLETPTAIANAAAIAAVPGIDCLLIGSNDLAMELGIPGAFADNRIAAAYEAVCDACRDHGKAAGIGGISDEALLRRYIEMGVRLVLPGSDLSMMARAAAETAAAMRAAL
jgi:2-keto-3-deoxy-L-rhamnonate aldolase RhmA